MTGSGDPVGGEPLPPEEARVRELLRAAAGTAGPMPADVVARVDAALARARDEQDAHAPGARVASLDGHRRSRGLRWRRALAAGAAAGVVAVGVGVAAQLDTGTGESASTSAGGAADTGSAAAEAAGTGATVPVLRSGTDYAADAAVAAAGASLLAAPADGGTGTGPTDGSGAGQPAPDALPGVDAERDLKASAVPLTGTPDEAQRPAAEQALACARAAGVDAASVAAVQIAAWRSEPAALVVERPAAGEAGQVLVVALDCTPGDEPLNRVELPAQPAGDTP
ncbi:hypothetical protein [Kineococcus auxinigenes]|uniref:hypothetical protein n=1 Tax=unclassified Kineococcus TaxID=2621656 RepID=UPI003D7DC389